MTRIARTLLASVLAALALSAAATAGGPGLSAGYGCALACIESALVTPTASSATVEVKTSVRTSVSVTATKIGASLGFAAGPAPQHVSVAPFLTNRTVLLAGLEPETSYRIVVSARDLQGRVQTRSGTFTTRKVKVAVDLPDVGFSAGLGCKADCIEKGRLTSDATVPGRARLELRSTVPATFQVRFVAKSASGTTLHQYILSTGSRKTAHETTIDGLLTGTRYTVTVKATDAEGRSREEAGTFRTRSAQAVVTFHKVTVISDSEKVGRGEISLDFGVGDVYAGGMGFQRIGSGDTVAVRAPGTSRPGLLLGVPIDGRPSIELAALATECDTVLMKNCLREAADWASGDYGHASGHYTTVGASTTVDLRDAFVSDGALPADYDAYVVWETTEHSLRYRVYATVDIRVS